MLESSIVASPASFVRDYPSLGPPDGNIQFHGRDFLEHGKCSIAHI